MTKARPKKTRPKARARRGPRITRVYTRTGDSGTTRLAAGREVAKHDPRIEAYGTVDELGVWVGAARRSLASQLQRCRANTAATAATADIADIAAEDRATTARKRAIKITVRNLTLLDRHLEYVQNLLFTLGADLATPLEDRFEGMPVIAAADTTYLERALDAYNQDLPPLEDFILAGGGQLAIDLQTCRVVCRRAERRTCELAGREALGMHVVPFINRLSDLFFVLGRWVVYELMDSDLTSEDQSGGGETIWRRDLRRPPMPKPRKKAAK